MACLPIHASLVGSLSKSRRILVRASNAPNVNVSRLSNETVNVVLPDPHATLRRWQGWLKPSGSLYVALLVAGSFDEWRAVCRSEGIEDGLWLLPAADFANDLAAYRDVQTITVSYSSAQEFLQRLKTIGASTPRPGHKPLKASSMRRVLAHAARPFPVSYQVLYLQLFAQDRA